MSLSSHHAHTFLRSLTVLIAIGVSVTTAACASSPTPPPAMAEPAANTLDQVAGKGATDTQPSSEDGVVFVEQEHKKGNVVVNVSHEERAPLHASGRDG